jgi:hypothetical protein
MTDLEKLAALAADAMRTVDIKRAAPKLARTLMENANRPLLIALVADFLTRQPDVAKLPITTTESTELQTQHAEKGPIGRRREGKHRRPTKVPGPLARAGEIASRKHLADSIFSRSIRGAGPLGRIKMHELRTIAQGQAFLAVEFLHRGYDDAVEAILCKLISEHCMSADPFAAVEDVISAAKAAEFEETARLRAAKVLRDGGARIARDLIEPPQA